jgi:hypothetical protein
MNQWLRSLGSEQLILKLGLARAWGGQDGQWNPLRCYLQLNGVIFASDFEHYVPEAWSDDDNELPF